jgi:Domain of unknown function (DUF4157)
MPEHQQTQKSTEVKSTSQKQVLSKIQAPSSHPMAIIQRARINPKSLTHADVMQLQRTIGNRAVGKLLTEIGLIPSETKQAQPVQMQTIPEEVKEPLQGKMIEPIQRQEVPEEEEPLQGKMIETIKRQEIPEEEEPLQGKFEDKPERATCPSCSAPTIQREENRTGMFDNLKAGVENLSGLDMSDVRVHYNSDKPAEVGALAYAQGIDIHVAPGQERHLPHEAWHVVQQKQRRVQPTIQIKDGISVNDDAGFEREADVMGRNALSSSNETKQELSVELGAHGPGSRGAQELIDSELTHVVPQGAMNNPIQLTRLENFQPTTQYFGDVGGNGTYATHYETEHREVSRLVDEIEAHLESIGSNEDIVILTGCHGDQVGNLIYTGDNFITQDQELAGPGVIVTNMQALNIDQQRAEMRRSDVVKILSWCYSAFTFANINNYEIYD